jgi:hypothetical protein
MFIIPLSIRSNINSLVGYAAEHGRLAVLDDVLYILLWDRRYVELLSVPLLGQREEASAVKALYITDASIAVDSGTLRITLVSEKNIYFLDPALSIIEQHAHGLPDPRVETWGRETVLFSSGSFYSGHSCRSMRISPYFSRIKGYACGRVSGQDVCLYRTEEYLSIYTTGGSCLVSKHPCTQQAFISDEKILVFHENEILVYELENGLRLVKKIDIKIRLQVEWAEVCCVREMLFMSGSTGSGYVCYVDGYLYNTRRLVQSFVLYRNCFLGISSSSLYFLPNDRDFDMDLLENEKRAVLGIFSGSFTPYVCRTFKFRAQRKAGCKVGHFLSAMAYHGFKVECKKLICNTLSDIRKDFGCVRQLHVLDEMSKFNFQIYRIFMSLGVDPALIYDRITEILDPRLIDEDLLLRMLDISFREIAFLDSPMYFFLKGKHLMESGDFMECFLRCDGLYGDVVKLLEQHNKFAELLVLWKETGYCLGTSLHHAGTIELLPRGAFDFVCELWNRNGRRNTELVDKFINGRYDLVPDVPPPLRVLLAPLLVESCLANEPALGAGIELLLRMERHADAAKLYFHKYRTTDNEEHLASCLEHIGDRTFVYDGKLYGRENLRATSRPEYDAKKMIYENTRKIQRNQCVWTDVLRAERYPREFSEYLDELNIAENLFFQGG